MDNNNSVKITDFTIFIKEHLKLLYKLKNGMANKQQ